MGAIAIRIRVVIIVQPMRSAPGSSAAITLMITEAL
jgi:hypothetical protein